jgi:hypothetical protein
MSYSGFWIISDHMTIQKLCGVDFPYRDYEKYFSVIFYVTLTVYEITHRSIDSEIIYSVEIRAKLADSE